VTYEICGLHTVATHTAPLTLRHPAHVQQLYWLFKPYFKFMAAGLILFVILSQTVHASVRLFSHAIAADFTSSRFQACVITDFPRG
jgi:hypothetical protein